MKTKLLNGVVVAVIAILIILMCYGGWHFERWLNWKYGYSGRVERKLEAIDRRLEALEKKIENGG